MNAEESLVLLSGGLDSTVLVYHLLTQGRVRALSFDYGQRHRSELSCAEATAHSLGIPWDVIRLSIPFGSNGGALIDTSIDVPDGHYADESMSITVVPNRNAIMLAIACAVAGAGTVAFAAHAGDHYIYADCRPEFVVAFDAMERLVMPGVRVIAPFAELDKTAIVRLGDELGIPFRATWSCYRGGATHCGICGTCVERREAFDLACVDDPTEYLT